MAGRARLDVDVRETAEPVTAGRDELVWAGNESAEQARQASAKQRRNGPGLGGRDETRIGQVEHDEA